MTQTNNKRNIYCDFDGVIANSIKAYCNVYKIMYDGNPDWTKVRRYDLRDQCPNIPIEDINKIFSNEMFFKYLEFMPNAYNVLKSLSEEFNIIICSIGTYQNISHKALWIESNLSFIKDAIFIKNKSCQMDKSNIDMFGGIIIDDVFHNLESSNAEVKILFDNNYLWNYGATYDYKTFDWLHVYNYITKL